MTWPPCICLNSVEVFSTHSWNNLTANNIVMNNKLREKSGKKVFPLHEMFVHRKKEKEMQKAVWTEMIDWEAERKSFEWQKSTKKEERKSGKFWVNSLDSQWFHEPEIKFTVFPFKNENHWKISVITYETMNIHDDDDDDDDMRAYQHKKG